MDRTKQAHLCREKCERLAAFKIYLSEAVFCGLLLIAAGMGTGLLLAKILRSFADFIKSLPANRCGTRVAAFSSPSISFSSSSLVIVYPFCRIA